MSLTKRLSIVRILTMIQLVGAAIVVLIIIAIALVVLFSRISEQGQMESEFVIPMIFGTFVITAIIIVITALPPAIVLVALKKRTESWATAAFVSLIVQLVIGGGIFSVIPLVSLILLLDKEASTYIGMK